MTISAVTGSDYALLIHGDKIPTRGLAVMGGLVYEDGKLRGCLKANLPWHPAVEHVLDVRGEWVRLFFEPLAEALAREKAA